MIEAAAASRRRLPGASAVAALAGVAAFLSTGALAAGTDAVDRKVSAPAGGSLFVTLGTIGGVHPTARRGEPANLLLADGRAILVDCGDGATSQLAKAGVRAGQIDTVFISHLHFDHIGGLGGLLGIRFQSKARTPLVIYGPPGTKALVAGLVASMQPGAAIGNGIPGAPRPDPAASVEVRELTDGSVVQVGAIKVSSAQNTHYSFEPGSAEDQLYKSLSFRFDLPDRSLLFTGDTGPSAKVEKLGKGADLLVSEMIDLDATLARIDAGKRAVGGAAAARPIEADDMQHLATHHLTPEEVGRMAKRMGVKKIVLTHLVVGRGTSEELAKDIEAVRAVYPVEVIAASDLDRF